MVHRPVARDALRLVGAPSELRELRAALAQRGVEVGPKLEQVTATALAKAGIDLAGLQPHDHTIEAAALKRWLAGPSQGGAGPTKLDAAKALDAALVTAGGRVEAAETKLLKVITALESKGELRAPLRDAGASLLGALDAATSGLAVVPAPLTEPARAQLQAGLDRLAEAHGAWRAALSSIVGRRIADGELSDPDFKAISKLRSQIEARFTELRAGIGLLGLHLGLLAREDGVDAARMDRALATINAPSFDPARLKAWVLQFDPADRATALEVLEHIDFHTFDRTKQDVRIAHEKLRAALVKDGFSKAQTGELFDNVDFSNLYAAKSGSFIGYLYRNENKIRSKCFQPLDGLKASATPKGDRALVILDDYTGTGVQFLFEGYATKYRELMSQYKKIYFVPLVAHEAAVEKFRQLADGKGREIGQRINEEYGVERPELKAEIISAMESLAGPRLELVTSKIERPLLSPQNPDLTDEQRTRFGAFLDKYKVYKYPHGIGGAEATTAFFYKPPNTLPEIFWTVKGSRDGAKWLPLFQRTDDVSEYTTAKYYEPEKQVWG